MHVVGRQWVQGSWARRGGQQTGDQGLSLQAVGGPGALGGLEAEK